MDDFSLILISSRDASKNSVIKDFVVKRHTCEHRYGKQLHLFFVFFYIVTVSAIAVLQIILASSEKKKSQNSLQTRPEYLAM